MGGGYTKCVAFGRRQHRSGRHERAIIISASKARSAHHVRHVDPFVPRDLDGVCEGVRHVGQRAAGETQQTQQRRAIAAHAI